MKVVPCPRSTGSEERRIAEAAPERFSRRKAEPVATLILTSRKYKPAEEYHQD